MGRPDENSRQSLLQRMLKSPVDDRNTLCPFGHIIFRFLTDVGSVRSKSRVAVDSVCTSVATQLEQVTYTTSIIMACYATDSRTKKVSMEGVGFVDHPVLSLDWPSVRNAHPIGWRVQHIVKA